MLGASLAPRVPGWTAADPTHLSKSFGAVGNVLLAPFVTWDGVGYLSIAEHGYARSGQTILFPGYPMLVSAIGFCLRSDAVAAVLVSLVSFAIALVLLHRLTRLELGERAADAAVLLLAFAPVSLFLTAAYTESLFLALSVGAVYAGRRKRWALAGLLAAAASVTRVTGILLVVPLAMMMLSDHRRQLWRLAWLAPAPLALLGFFAYMQTRGYGWLAPLRNQHAHVFGGPLVTLGAAVSAAWHGVGQLVGGARPVEPMLIGVFSPGFDSIVLIVVFVLVVTALVIAWRRLPRPYVALAALEILVCIASQTKIQPLESLDRYSLTIFPLWMAAGAWASRRGATRPLLIVGGALLAFYSFEFPTWAYVA